MDSRTDGYAGVKKIQQDATEELLTRLVHRMARSLGAFRSTTQALLNGADEDPMLRRELLQDMETELGELQRLLENVTQLKALQRGTFRLNPRDVSPSPWLRQLAARWQRAAKDKSLSWIVERARRVAADPCGHGQAGAEPEQPVIQRGAAHARRRPHYVHGPRDGDSLVMKISSDKPRLESEEYDHLFELFYTGEIQGRFPVGTGLGLHVTRQLVEQHGGRIEVVPPSEENDAVGFEVRMPFADGSYSKSERLTAS